MDTLPTELCREVISYLSLFSIKALRLASRQWASLGSEYLIDPRFRILQNRDDCNRLLALSAHPFLSTYIQELCFEMGEVDEYHARHNSYFIGYLQDPDERQVRSTAAWDEYRMYYTLKEKHAKDFCDSGLLEQAFRSLPRLESLHVRLSKCPFEDELWGQIWNRPSSRLLPRAATMQRFSSMLIAAAPCKLKWLSHDRLPVEFWGQIPETVNYAVEAFRGLENISLILDYSKSHHESLGNGYLQGLGRCLNAATNLKVLGLGFWAAAKPLVMFSTSFGDDFVWPNLQTLSLEGLRVNSPDISLFLHRHKASLKRLQLGGTGTKNSRYSMAEGILLDGSTFHEFCTKLRGLQLESLNIRPLLGPSPMGRSTEDNEPLYDDDWKRIGTNDSRSARLEAFVLGLGPWTESEEPPLADEPLAIPDDFF